MNKHRHESVSITVTSWICNNSWTTGWSDRIECLGFSDHRSDYQFWATNKVRSPSPIWSYQFLKSFRSPIWSDRITDHRNLHIPQLEITRSIIRTIMTTRLFTLSFTQFSQSPKYLTPF